MSVEKDELLVQRLLVPLLWNGSLPCVSKRAFVDGCLKNEVLIVTNKEWPLNENPISYDWIHSRGVLPKGFYRPGPEFPAVNFHLTEYFQINLSRIALKKIFSNIPDQLTAGVPKINRTGLAGRPSARDFIGPEIERRAIKGERYSTIREWGDVLEKWYNDAYCGKGPSATSKTIINSFRSRLKNLLSSVEQRKRPEPRPK